MSIQHHEPQVFAPSRWVLVASDFVLHGGMDRANYALADFLARSGDRVELVTHRAAEELVRRKGLAVHHVRRPLGSDFIGAWGLSIAGRRNTRSKGVRAVVNGGNCPIPAANWIHYVHAAYRPELPVSRLLRIKSRIARPIDLKSERSALREARVVICNSNRTRRDVIDLGVAPERAVTIYYGCDSAFFRPAAPGEREDLRRRLAWSAEQPVVLFVGAMSDRRKGFDTLFQAWQRVCREPGWDARLIVVGRGAEVPVWERRAADAGLQDRIGFLGFRKDVPDLMRAADAIVHPARYEAYGLGVHEALCCGLPAIVSASAGVAERYPADLRELLLADPENASELAERLRDWRAIRDPLAARVRALAEELRARTWDHMAREIRDAILLA